MWWAMSPQRTGAVALSWASPCGVNHGDLYESLPLHSGCHFVVALLRFRVNHSLQRDYEKQCVLLRNRNVVFRQRQFDLEMEPKVWYPKDLGSIPGVLTATVKKINDSLSIRLKCFRRQWIVPP